MVMVEFRLLVRIAVAGLVLGFVAGLAVACSFGDQPRPPPSAATHTVVVRPIPSTGEPLTGTTVHPAPSTA